MWLHSLRLDAVFGWRQLLKKKTASTAALLSLALAIGACTAALRLIDALLLRPLPVASPERLYAVAFEGTGVDGRRMTYDSCLYPMFRRMRAAVREQGESIAVSYADRVDLTYGSDLDMERAYLQFVSGGMFPAFGLRPAGGPPAHRKRRPHARRTSRGGAVLRLLVPPLRTRSEGHRAHVPHGRPRLRGCRSSRKALHRHGNRHQDRSLRPHGDEELADA